MDVSQTTAATGANASKRATAGEEDPNRKVNAADFQTFLTLLTTQMKNQDPLNPTDSTEFVAQLASFSGVEQQVRANEQLEKIYGALGGGATSGLAAWIGTEVRAAAQAAFSGDPVSVLADPAKGADRAVMTVTDDFGNAVAQVEVSPTAASLSWDGKNALGETQPDGLYSFAIASYKDGELLGTKPGEVFAKVAEVRIEGGEPVLMLEGGAKARVDAVSALR